MVVQNGTLITPTIRNLNLQNPRWRTAAILKTFKSPYLCNCSTNFNKIWHGDVLSPFQITHTYTLDNVNYSQAQGLNLKHRWQDDSGYLKNDEQTDGFLDEI